MRRALVLGGSGYVGSAVVDALCRRGIATTFTWCEGQPRAETLAHRTGATACQLDLRSVDQIRSFAADLPEAPDVIIHLASHSDWRSLDDIDLAGWDEVFAVTVRGPFALIQALAGSLRERGGDIVFATGMAPLRTVAAPPQAAAAQAALAGLARSLTRALAPRVRTNVVALGTLAGGTADRIATGFATDQKRFSALARLGTADEIAQAIAWVALANSYLSGAVIPVAGGL